MKGPAALLLLAAALLAPSAQALVFDSAGAKTYPVSKVVKLLRDMQAQLEKEGEEDEDAYDKMGCWCQTNEKVKTKSIEEAQSIVAQLQSTIESTAGSSGQLTAEIKHHESDLEKSKSALDQATTLRQQASAQFVAEEKDLLQSIKSLDAALVVLGKHHKASMLDEKTLHSVTEVMRTEMKKHHDLLEGTITPHERKLVMLGQSQTTKAEYSPQSGEIFGILGQMKETFETNLKESQKQEAADSKTYQDLKAAKSEEINAISDSVDEKKQQLAEADSTNAESKEALRDKNAVLEEDQKFLTDLKQRCSTMDLEFDQRKKTRADEVSAVTEAISILSADAAHDTFSKTFNPASFLQTSAVNEESQRRNAASALLKDAAMSSNDPKLAALAVTVNLDAFTQVKAEIDAMVAALDKAKKDDFQQRDTCVAELNKNEQQTAEEERNKVDFSAEVEEKKATVEEQKNNIQTMTDQVADLKLQMSRATEDRAKAKKAFEATLADQRETQSLLQKALAVLKGAYGSKAALVQQAPPPGFKERSANGAGGVLGMIEMIIEDAKGMEKETLQAEEEDKAKYAAFAADTTASVDKLQVELVDQKATLAAKEQDLAQAEINLRDTNTELENLANSKVALKMGCDSLLANFDSRQMAFEQEIDALKQAKAILSGMQA